jgi:hypothetical protein
MFGATRYETASNLPTQKCPGGWEFFQRVDLTPRGELRYSVDTAVVRRHIEQRGWHVWDETPRDERDAAPVKSSSQEEKAPAETERVSPKAPSDLSSELWKDKLEEVLAATTPAQQPAAAESVESPKPAEEVAKEEPGVPSRRDYNFVRPIADLLSSNPPPAKSRPVERTPRVSAEAPTRTPPEKPTRAPEERSARAQVESTPRVERSARVQPDPAPGLSVGPARAPAEPATRP